jgi:hypothetical protein
VDGHEGTTQKVFSERSSVQIELRRALNAVSMKKEDDPAILFEPISATENKYDSVNYQIPKEDRIATVLEKAPKEYGTVLTVEQRSKGNNLNSEDLHDDKSQLWRTLYQNETVAGGGDEIWLASADSNITCYRCKKTGHKAFSVQAGPRVVVAVQAMPVNIVIAREMERSFKASAIYVASNATRK